MSALTAKWDDVWLLDGMRTPFVDYNGALAAISPIDLGIKAARAVFAHSGAAPEDVGTVITGNMAQASFDTFLTPRHIGLYSGVPIETPAHMVQRVCGTGIEVLMQAADTISHRGVDLALCVGTEFDEPQSGRRLHASRRLPHGAGRVQGLPVGGARAIPPRRRHDGRHGREPRAAVPDHAAQVDAYAARSFARAVAAQEYGFLAGEIAPVDERDVRASRATSRAASSSRATPKSLDHDTHVRPSPLETLAKIRPAFGGVQTGGNSSAIVDGAAARARGLGRLRAEARQGAARPHRGGRRRSACRRRSWASARCRRSRRRSRRPA